MPYCANKMTKSIRLKILTLCTDNYIYQSPSQEANIITIKKSPVFGGT